MRRAILIAVTVACAIGLGAFVAIRGSAQQKAQVNNHKTPDKDTPQDNKHKKPKPFPTATPPPYNPYPPGILPADLDSELARVEREIDVIEARAIARWLALPPPDLTGQPQHFRTPELK
jgi:hypothetical protein